MNSVPPDCAPDHPGCEHSHGILGAGDRSRELRGAGKRSLALALVLIVGTPPTGATKTTTSAT